MPQVMEHLKPGAWFELAELGFEMFSDDKSLPEDWPPKVAFDAGRKALIPLGRQVPDAEFLEKLLVDNGFVDVKVGN